MSLSNRLGLPVILSVLALLVGCSSSSNSAIAPPSGKFSNSSMTGSYAFSAGGTDSSGVFFSLAGSLQANGSGVITGGTLDLNDPNSAVVSGVAITGGNYAVTADGRGQATLRTASGSITLDFVLLNNLHAMVTRYDNNGTGGGSMDLQTTVTQAQLAGSYAFNFGGIDSNGNPLATVGAFTLDASGNISAGVEDFNDAGVAFPALTLTGNVKVGTGGAPGAATLTAMNSSSAVPFGNLNFDVYVVDGTHLKFVEKDAAPIVSGDAFTQQGASLPSKSTVLAFTMAGGVSAPLSVAGLMPIDGVSAISNGSEDINNNGTVPSASISFTGSYAASGSTGGRTLFDLTGFDGATQLAAYPTASAGIQLLEIDNGGLLGGIALAQTGGATLASSQGYGLGLTGINIGGATGAFEEDDIAEFTTTTGSFSGLIDINDQGSLSFDQKFTGNYVADSSGTGRGTLTSNVVNGIYYSVDGSTALFLETDNNQVGSGSIQLQTAGTQSGAEAGHMAVLHLAPVGHKSSTRK